MEEEESMEQDSAGTDEQELDQEEMQKQMARMLTSVKDMTLYNMSMLASQAWHHLGLVPIPGSEAGSMDLEQAKMAIDIFEATLKVMEPYMEAEQIKEFKRVLMDLHMNYVNKSKNE